MSRKRSICFYETNFDHIFIFTHAQWLFKTCKQDRDKYFFKGTTENNASFMLNYALLKNVVTDILVYVDENFNGDNCGFMEYDYGQLQQEWYPDYIDQATEYSNHVWENDKNVEDFQPDHHPQLTMLC